MKFFITGGTGSLGQALVKKLLEEDHQVIIYSRDEGKQALIYKGMHGVKCVIGDVRDLDRLKTAIKFHKPDRIIHAAALKRIDDMEMSPTECLKTNVDGSRNVAIAALEASIPKCILVSTDKACQPVNVYGASKFVSERLYTNFDYTSDETVFSSVRYGNVIASRGSFIPLWLDAVRSKKLIPITSMECSRFLFKLSEAVDTVLSSLEFAEGGEVFIPQINSFSIKMVLEVLKDIAGVDELNHKLIGLRPGEKIHEDMLSQIELPLSCSVSSSLIAVLPQYTNKKHSFSLPYEGPELNSEKYLSQDAGLLKKLILEGLSDAG
jgi:UDP-N-acetylglucosamine 4,6-dehydratase